MLYCLPSYPKGANLLHKHPVSMSFLRQEYNDLRFPLLVFCACPCFTNKIESNILLVATRLARLYFWPRGAHMTDECSSGLSSATVTDIGRKGVGGCRPSMEASLYMNNTKWMYLIVRTLHFYINERVERGKVGHLNLIYIPVCPH